MMPVLFLWAISISVFTCGDRPQTRSVQLALLEHILNQDNQVSTRFDLRQANLRILQDGHIWRLQERSDQFVLDNLAAEDVAKADMNEPNTKALPTLHEFVAGPDSLAAYSDGELTFRSQAGDLKPLVDLLRTDEAKKDRLSLCVYDRYVGRAAALLMARVRPAKVLTGVISKGGALALSDQGIAFEAGEQVEYLMGVASAGMCRWEKMAMGRTSDEFWGRLQSLPEFAQTDPAE